MGVSPPRRQCVRMERLPCQFPHPPAASWVVHHVGLRVVVGSIVVAVRVRSTVALAAENRTGLRLLGLAVAAELGVVPNGLLHVAGVLVNDEPKAARLVRGLVDDEVVAHDGAVLAEVVLELLLAHAVGNAAHKNAVHLLARRNQVTSALLLYRLLNVNNHVVDLVVGGEDGLHRRVIVKGHEAEAPGTPRGFVGHDLRVHYGSKLAEVVAQRFGSGAAIQSTRENLEGLEVALGESATRIAAEKIAPLGWAITCRGSRHGEASVPLSANGSAYTPLLRINR
ncbi:terpenoid synthase [Babesia caballi]|uniref:Terpenoid synthase n=1 Tax=Babesia caballi TaxID=5871 RepID=A0AAV4LTB7_BABCB|nr:terpenoid synthase [Babesia caballi]